VVEYLRPQGQISKVATVAHRDPTTRAIIRAAGLIAFESGEVSTFDVGYTAGTVIMKLELLGTAGVIEIVFFNDAGGSVIMKLELLGTAGVIEKDDFVLDWTNSFAFQNPDIKTGY